MHASDETLMEMYKAASHAVEFAGGTNKTAFMLDVKTHSAVLYQLLIMQQAAGNLGDEFRGEHPNFPWEAIDAMGAGTTIELNDAWDILWRDIPAIVTAVETVIPHGGDS